MALVIGYFLQIIPFRSLFVLTLKFCLILARPVLFMACAFQLAKYVIKHSNSGDRATLNRATNLADIERHVLFAEALLKMSLRHGEPDWHAHASGFPVGWLT